MRLFINENSPKVKKSGLFDDSDGTCVDIIENDPMPKQPDYIKWGKVDPCLNSPLQES
jgi:hypothetical protein